VPIIEITDAEDPRIADYRGVPDPVLLRDRGLFVAEGRLVVRTLLAHSRYGLESVLVSPAALESFGDMRPQLDATTVFVAGFDVLEAIVGFNIHRGCLALGRRGTPLGVHEALAHGCDRSHIVILERVANADNVGAIFRNARAFGAGCVLLSPSCCDPLYRKAIRVSIGANLQLPFAYVDAWPSGLVAVRESGYTIVALTPRADAHELMDLAPALPARVALLLGHEGDGLSEEAIASADLLARIRMADGADSVNVAAAAGIALYVCASVAGQTGSTVVSAPLPE
jgi:tRNA G18 (ribose-2'-O)-methylase SpoU